MERLTKRINGIVTYIGKHKKFEAETAAELETTAVREVLERLADYEDGKYSSTVEGEWVLQQVHVGCGCYITIMKCSRCGRRTERIEPLCYGCGAKMHFNIESINEGGGVGNGRQ